MKIWTGYIDRNLKKINVGDILENNDIGYVYFIDKDLYFIRQGRKDKIDDVDLTDYKVIANVNKHADKVKRFYAKIEPCHLDYEINREFKDIIKKTKENIYVWQEVYPDVFTCRYGVYRLLAKFLVLTVEYVEKGNFVEVLVSQRKVKKLVKAIRKQRNLYEK